MKVTFIGVGAIGLPMALRVQGVGHDVTAVESAEAAAASARGRGIATVRALGDAPPAPIIVVMVATPAQLAAVVDAALGATSATSGSSAVTALSALTAPRPGHPLSGSLWLLMSTVGPQAARAAAERLQRAGARVVDAPVTGGVARARTGELRIFGAGTAEDIEAARPVLDAMGSVAVTGSRPGDGQSIKLVNQHLCAVHLVAAAEALSLARSLGLDPTAVLGLVETGAAGSWMLSDRGPRMVAGTDVEVTSAIDIFVKDSSLVKGAGEACGAVLPLLATAHQRFRLAAQAGLGPRDDSRVIETWPIAG